MFPNTKKYITEYTRLVEKKDFVNLISVGFKFPFILYQDLKLLSKRQLIVFGTTVIVVFGVSNLMGNKLSSVNEESVLKCDCSIERDNDYIYFFWYNVGQSYGEKIPKLVNVSNILDDKTEFGKSFFTISWMKKWIYINGGQNLGGVPKMTKYIECWEKGFLIGRNNYLENE
jgi:hypothetical protein